MHTLHHVAVNLTRRPWCRLGRFGRWLFTRALFLPADAAVWCRMGGEFSGWWCAWSPAV